VLARVASKLEERREEDSRDDALRLLEDLEKLL
jgi:hypothetical protein